MRPSNAIPYVVGQWVRGERFYGRKQILSEVLQGPRDTLWFLGTRRIGKTSLLKQLELRTSTETSGFVPLFWDFQGADEPSELHLSFYDAVLDAEERLGALGVDLEAMDPDDLFGSLAHLRRHVRLTGKRLLLLCDEVEELIKLQTQDPTLLHKLRRGLVSGGDVRSVLASTIRLWALNKELGDISSFLHGFAPPLYLSVMSDSEARSLLQQEHLPKEALPAMSSEVIERIRVACDNHPYLLQLTAKRYLELRSVDDAIEQVATDEMVSYFFAVDFEMLESVEQKILRRVVEVMASDSDFLEEEVGPNASQDAGGLLRLESLGFLRRTGEGQFVVSNYFFQEWIRWSEPEVGLQEARSMGTRPFAERVTEILSQIDSRPKENELASPQDLLEVVYDDLRQLARRYMSRERVDHTLQPTALVHEAYMKLAYQSGVEWQGRTHFYAVGAQAMRRILIDHARGRHREKRGGEWLRISWAEEVFPNRKRDLSDEELMDLDQAIEELEKVEKRQAWIVELRFFAGLTVKEVAEALGVSERTADGDWAKARRWLQERLSQRADSS